VEVNLLEAMIALGSYQVSRYLGASEDAERIGNGHRSIVPYGTFKTADGFVNIAGGNDRLFTHLARALEANVLLEPRFATNAARVQHRDEVNARLEAALARFTTTEAVTRLQNAGVPCGPVWSVAEALESDFVQSRGIVRDVPHSSLGTVRVTAPPFELDGEALPVRFAPPTLNEHANWLEDVLNADDATRPN
jgi:crotonobetainyl-CoA:carnitine CoA-transferase CaiB-like acyl-CoA transferase